MKTLSAIRNQLARYKDQECASYFVPKLWNTFDYQYIISQTAETIEVNPYRFIWEAINYLLKQKKYNCGKGVSLSAHLGKKDGGAWIKDAVIYSLQVRTSTCFPHGPSYETNGTFLKTIAFIPYLMHLGVTCLYLLPITKIGQHYRKGELGSPYAVEDFFALEPSLADPLISADVNQQFSALVEALHCVGIRLTIDFIPRTMSRSSQLIRQHPDWFYYIKKSDIDRYNVPEVNTIDRLQVATPQHAPALYRSPEVAQFLKLFVANPQATQPKMFAAALAQEDFFAALEAADYTTAPAFADVINDPQPPWQDVTYLRLYLDHPQAAKKYLRRNQVPYILFDVAKASLNPGGISNQELWDLLISVLPYYQKTFGIDGARIDMGHALPRPLSRAINQACRKVDPSFALIAEELNNGKAEEALSNGYNIIVGDGFFKLPRVKDFLFHEFVYDAHKYALPQLFQVESHDTPRAVTRSGGRCFATCALAFSFFVPGCVPFINSGQELMETRAMNNGLDPVSGQIGKMALFDQVFFNYNQDGAPTIKMIHQLTALRNKVISPETTPLGFLHMREDGAGFCYYHDDIIYLVIAHTNFNSGENLTVRLDNIKARINQEIDHFDLVYATTPCPSRISSFNFDGSLNLWMEAGEVKILSFSLDKQLTKKG